MKKIITSLVLSLAFVFAVPALTTHAAGIPAQTVVTGVVKAGSTPVPGANVSVSCNGSTDSDVTDEDGGYGVGFTQAQCPTGAAVQVSASKSGANGSNTGTAAKQSTRLNVALVDVNVALPEMGTIVGGVAAIGGAGALMVVRRRQQNNVDQA